MHGWGCDPKIRSGRTGSDGINRGWRLPPGICAKLDTDPSTFPNPSGRCQAAVKAAFPSLL